MTYNNNWLLEKYDNGDELDYVFFWGHQPRRAHEIGKACFSQWFDRGFEYENVRYKTAEHWMMAKKAELFGDIASMREILDSETPNDAKMLGRKVKNFDFQLWMAHCSRIVEQGNYLKFSQHEDLWAILNGTGDKILVEASPFDTIWGIGMKYNEQGIRNPYNWKGQNLLGYALMEVRNLFRNN